MICFLKFIYFCQDFIYFAIGQESILSESSLIDIFVYPKVFEEILEFKNSEWFKFYIHKKAIKINYLSCENLY